MPPHAACADVLLLLRVGSRHSDSSFSPVTSLQILLQIQMKQIFAVSATFYLLLECNSFKMVQEESLEESWAKPPPKAKAKPSKDIDFDAVQKCRDDEEERLKRQQQESHGWSIFGDVVGTVCGGGGGGKRRGKGRRLFLMEEREDLGEDIGQNMSQDISQDLQSNASTQFIFTAFALGCAVAGPGADLASGYVDRAHESENLDATNCDRMMADLTLRKLDELDEKVDQGFKDVKADIGNLEAKMDAQHRATAMMLNAIARQEAEGQLKMQTLIQRDVMQEMKALGQDTALLSAKLDQERVQVRKREKRPICCYCIYYLYKYYIVIVDIVVHKGWYVPWESLYL